MAHIVADKVAGSSTTTGTGDLTISAGITGYTAFSSAMAVSDTAHCMVTAVDANGVPTGDWEAGLYTYSASNTLTRTTVTASSNAGAAVNFGAGTKRIAISRTAATQKFRGALVTKASDQTGASYTTATAIAWDSETYDTDAIHDNASNNTRLTVPTGVLRVRLSAAVRITSSASANWLQITLAKGGSVAFAGSTMSSIEQSATVGQGIAFVSPVLSVTGGDYFEVQLQSESDTSIDIIANRSWFAMEIIE